MLPGSYREYTGKLELPQDQKALKQIVIQTIVTIAPLLLAAGFGLNALVYEQYGRSTVIFATGIVAWGILRLTFQKSPIARSKEGN